MDTHDSGDLDGGSTAHAVSEDGLVVYATGRLEEDLMTTAIHAPSGITLWLARLAGTGRLTGTDIATDPTGNRVFVTSVAIGGEPVTAAYHARSGILLWQVHHGGSDAVLRVAPDGATIFVANSERADTRPLVALDATTGLVRWQIPFIGYDLALSPDGMTLFAAGGHGVWAFNASTGSAIWDVPYSHPAGSYRWLDISPDGERLYAASWFRVAAIDATTGEVHWDRSGLPAATIGVATTPDGLFVGGASYSAVFLTRIDSKTGATLWTTEERTPDLQLEIARMAANPNGARVYFVTSAWQFAPSDIYFLAAFDTSDGETLWTRTQKPIDGEGQASRSLTVDPSGARLLVGADATGGVAYATHVPPRPFSPLPV